jgi:hypothetical protein
MVLINTGKKTISAQTMTFDNRPKPNQITSRGAKATMGMDWEATI